MTTSVTVHDDIRRKLKRLAAMLDITQAEVIERALILYEDQVSSQRSQRKASKRILEALKDASSKIRRSDPEWRRISRTIDAGAASLEKIIAASWGKEL